ncbi:MAG: hypothetical protein U9N77_02270 [Thermodesulfobacteriota bacterium]|nr:hypothetical protein [Thermodesulfobacteriota bacterium]
MTFKEKLKELRNSSEDTKIDWGKNKKDWIDSVKLLFSTIQDDWFSELEAEGLLKINTSLISISEEYIGTYTIDKMEITYSTSCVVFAPVGRNIIGGEGRIDLYLKGEFGKGLMLILYRENNTDNWFIVSKESRREKELLSKSSLERTIEQWI